MIIDSLLDNDLYAFTQLQAVLHHYPATIVKYKFKCRNNPNPLNKVDDRFINELNTEINNLCELKFTEEELNYLSTIRFFKSDFIEYLRLFRFNRKYISVGLDTNNDLFITIEGPWLSTILFEVPVLAIVSEIYGRRFYYISLRILWAEGAKRNLEKIELLNEVGGDFQFVDFGTRRRFCKQWQALTLRMFREKRPINLVGTSNVMFAKEFGIKPIGTMSHQWLQAHQQLYRIADSQKMALETWAKEYRGDLGIALSDVVGFDAFLRDFDLYFSKLFDGCRHDSGDPYQWCEKLINHYKKLNINPKTKFAVFSDGLDFERAIKLHETFNDRINVSFGIGTHFTNDIGVTPLNIVIKMTECNGKPVAKLSDSPGKQMCEDEEYLSYLKKVFK